MKRWAATLVLAGHVSLSSRGAAQGIDWGRIKETVVPSEEADEARKRAKPKVREASGLFDGSNSTIGLELDAGPLWYRANDAGREGFRSGTLALGAGQTTTASTEHAYLAGSLRTALRAFDRTTYFWTTFQVGFASGLKAGPLELEAQIGLGLVGISAAQAEWSVDILAPRVGLSAAAHAGRFRLAVGAYSEYLWRLFGMGYTARGLTLSLRFDLAPVP